MFPIPQYISELLFFYDCVIIPNFGGFVASDKPAAIIQSKQIIQLPTKTICFNSGLKQHDGLLANYIASKNNILYKQALQEINNYVANVNEQLNQNKKVYLLNIGTLAYNQNKTIVFEPDAKATFVPHTFGLTNINFACLANTQNKNEKIATNQNNTSKTANRTLQPYKRTTAMAALPLLLLLSFIPFQNVNNNTQQSNVNVIQTLAQANSAPATQDEFLSDEDFDKEMYFQDTPTPEPTKQPGVTVISPSPEEPVSNTIYQSETPVTAAPVVTETYSAPKKTEPKYQPQNNFTSQASGNYTVVVGSFKVRTNAQTFINTLSAQGYNGQIVRQNNAGYYLVSIGSYNSKAEAKRQMQKYAETTAMPAWLDQ